jgi:hypothetical protein
LLQRVEFTFLGVFKGMGNTIGRRRGDRSKSKFKDEMKLVVLVSVVQQLPIT